MRGFALARLREARFCSGFSCYVAAQGLIFNGVAKGNGPTPPLYTSHAALYGSTFYTLRAAHRTIFTFQALHSTPYTPHAALPTLRRTFCILHWAFYTPDSTVYTLHSAFSIPRCRPHALHSTRYILCAALSILHCASAPRFTFRALHCTPDTLRTTPYTVHSAFCGIVCMFHSLCPNHVRQWWCIGKLWNAAPFTLSLQWKHGGLRRFFLFSHPRQCKSARRRRSKHLVGKPPRVPPADILSVVRCDLVRPTWCLMTCRGDSQRVDTRMVSFKSFRFFAAGAILGEI